MEYQSHRTSFTVASGTVEAAEAVGRQVERPADLLYTEWLGAAERSPAAQGVDSPKPTGNRLF